jgi:hypothetical protein
VFFGWQFHAISGMLNDWALSLSGVSAIVAHGARWRIYVAESGSARTRRYEK